MRRCLDVINNSDSQLPLFIGGKLQLQAQACQQNSRADRSDRRLPDLFSKDQKVAQEFHNSKKNMEGNDLKTPRKLQNDIKFQRHEMKKQQNIWNSDSVAPGGQNIKNLVNQPSSIKVDYASTATIFNPAAAADVRHAAADSKNEDSTKTASSSNQQQ